MSSVQKLTLIKYPIRRNLWLERLIAIIILVNFCLVLFDLTYFPGRDFYFQNIPGLTQLYDPIKGIEPHRETQKYLHQAQEIEKQIMQTGLHSPQVENLLEEMRNLSNELIEDNPFAVANKTRHLENIKNQMRDRVGISSAHRAFFTFWSPAYLSQAGWEKEISFFNTHIRPQIETNYYRGLGASGKFIDRFWLIDLPFVILFGLEFLVRTFSISRQRPGLNWLEAMLRRWYDIFLLLPFWQCLRVIPLTIRLYQADLLNLEPVRKQIKYDFVINFAEEIAEIVGIRLIDQVQESIERGDVSRWLLRPETRRPYININNTNEVQAIASRLLYLTVHQVIPKIQPDIEALLHYSLENTLKKSAIYQQLQNIPGLKNVPNQMTEKLATDISQTTYSTLATLLEDPVAVEMTNRLIQNFTEALEVEVKKQPNLQEIQSLLLDLLEEVKINYIRGIAEGGVEKSLEEVTQLHQIIH